MRRGVTLVSRAGYVALFGDSRRPNGVLDSDRTLRKRREDGTVAGKVVFAAGKTRLRRGHDPADLRAALAVDPAVGTSMIRFRPLLESLMQVRRQAV